jgi:molecular chaperone DnaJ
MRGGFIFSKTCTQCSGAGKHIHNPCIKCHGSKFINTNEEIDINVPAGVTEDYALQFKGKGNQFGRSVGDLIIRLAVRTESSPILLFIK